MVSQIQDKDDEAAIKIEDKFEKAADLMISSSMNMLALNFGFLAFAVSVSAKEGNHLVLLVLQGIFVLCSVIFGHFAISTRIVFFCDSGGDRYINNITIKKILLKYNLQRVFLYAGLLVFFVSMISVYSLKDFGVLIPHQTGGNDVSFKYIDKIYAMDFQNTSTKIKTHLSWPCQQSFKSTKMKSHFCNRSHDFKCVSLNGFLGFDLQGECVFGNIDH